MNNLRNILGQTKDGKWKYIIIIAIIVVKVLLMGLFSSDYQNKMFRPFVLNFLEGNNPYEYYYSHKFIASFPYFPLMLLINSAGGLFVKLFAISCVFLENIVFKAPLLLFDGIGYYYIRKIGVRFKYAIIFYFCSPIVLYATYMHGQLDIISTAFFIVAVYYLLDWRKKYHLLLYALFLGLALGTKLHILAAIPILFIYIMKKRDFGTALRYHLVTAAVLFLLTYPFWGEGFIHTVLFNKEQSLLTTINFDYGTTQVLIPIFVLLIIYFSVLELNYFNRTLLLSILGLLFAVFLICVPPMPAWFTWIVPFIAIYFGYVEQSRHKVMFLYAVFNAVYLLYFVLLHRTEYVDLYFLEKSLQFCKIMVEPLKYMVFTVMSVCLGIIVFKIYKFGLASNKLYQRKEKSFIIGIAGDSGAGKSRMLEKIKHLVGDGKDILFIEGDADHRWVRGDKNWERYTSLNPQANYLYRQAEDLRKLKDGIYVNRVEYDHDSGEFTESRRVTPKKFIVLHGLHSLYLPKLRNVLDLKIYMDTEDELRKYWKMQRDVSERGYTREKVIAQIEKRYPDAEKYIYPQREYADVVITYFDKTLNDCLARNHNIILSVKFEMTIDWDIEQLVRSFQRYGLHLEWTLSEDFLRQKITFDGEELLRSELDLASIVEENIPQYEDIFVCEPIWGLGIEGVVQVMILFIISEKMRA